MLDAFKNLLNSRFSFLKDTPLLLAVSGGLDSMVLADLCMKSGLDIALAHCNFKLRSEESDEDEVFIKTFAQTNNLEVFIIFSMEKRSFRNILKVKNFFKNSKKVLFTKMFTSIIMKFNNFDIDFKNLKFGKYKF